MNLSSEIIEIKDEEIIDDNSINGILDSYFKTNDKKYLDMFIEKVTNDSLIDIDVKYLSYEINGKMLLELILENNKDANFSRDLKRYIYFTPELLKVYFDNNYLYEFDGVFHMLYNYNDKFYLQDYFGTTLMEYLIRENKINKEMISHINNTLLVELCVKYNKLDLLQYSERETILLANYDADKTVLDYLFEHDLINSNNVESIKTSVIYDYITKYNRPELLSKIKEEALLSEYHGKTLLEELISKDIKIEPFIYDIKSVDIILRSGKDDYLKRVGSTLLLEVVPSYNKTFLEVLIDKNLLLDIIKDCINYSTKNSDEAIKIIYKNNKLNFLQNVSEDIFLKKINGRYIFEDLIAAGYKPVPNLVYKNKEIIPLLLKYNMYDSLADSSSEILMTRLDNGRLVIEELMARNIPLSKRCRVDNIELANILIEHKKFEYYKLFSDKMLYENYDMNNTFLDLFLEESKKNKTIDISYFDNYTSDLNIKAKKYIIYAKHDFQMYLKSLDKEKLLEKRKDKRLIDILLELDASLTINKLLRNDVKEDFEIAMILKSKGFSQDKIKVDSITKKLESEYIDRITAKYSSLKLKEDDELLLQELRNTMSDGKSDSKLIDSLVASYRYLLSINSPFKQEIYNIIKVKTEVKSFSYQNVETGAYYSNSDHSVHMDDGNIDTLNHETGHALYHNLTNGNIPDEFETIIDNLSKSADFIKKVEEYSKMYNEIKKQIIERVSRTYMEVYDESITEDKKAEIEEFIVKDKDKKKKEYLEKGYDEKTLDRIFSEIFTLDEYLFQDRRIKKEEIVELILRIEYGPFIAIGDYIDGITTGRFRDNILENKEGKTIESAFGHGVYYYNNKINFVFDEMLANYSAIAKSETSVDGLNALRYFIGDELFNMISEYYTREILNSKKFEKESSISL